jgi:hypothetical protein
VDRKVLLQLRPLLSLLPEVKKLVPQLEEQIHVT